MTATLCFGLIVLANSLDDIEFDRDIRPILSDNCYACHGPDAGARKAEFRLDIEERAKQKRDDGRAAIVPGVPQQSELVRRILSSDPHEVMPPAHHRKKLTEHEKNILVRWIENGAPWETHWAYRLPERPSLPETQNPQWPANPIDHFILARLEQAQLTPSPEEERATLIRRLNFDLLGLPPEPEDVTIFIRDSSTTAYEQLVDRTLGSAHFGERMAVFWLDLVRYADTNGYHADLEWSVSPYRDYVIDAFNDNIPFDQFTREQLGGDLLNNPTLEQRIAAGYNRLNMKSTEFGIQDREYLAKYASDRVRTTSTVWLGATLGCAECHDHKFDPYTAEDFYRFSALFADIKGLGFYPDAHKKGWGESLVVPNPEDRAEYFELQERIRDFETRVKERVDELAPGLDAWVAEQRTQVIHNDFFPRLSDARVHKGQGDPWWYTTDDPGDNWASADYDPSEWKRGPGGFGTSETPNTIIGTEWRTNQIWLRKHFSLREIPSELFLDVHHDEDAWIYLNGKQVAELSGYSTRFIRISLGPEEQDALRAGENILAVHCRQTSGGQYIDVGITNDPLSVDVKAFLSLSTEEWTPKQRTTVIHHYHETDETWSSLSHAKRKLEQRLDEIKTAGRTMLATVSTKRRSTRVLARGDWMDDTGPLVDPGVPRFLTPHAEVDNRLDLARWMTSSENPLTARVMVNRLWKLFFGTGLSRVLDDLGSQGEWPSHPQLLDWLAVEFMESGWNIKHVVRLIVTSNTYRQSSRERFDTRSADPLNRLLGRQNRYRLDAEFIRDNALAVSGLLNRRIGGSSVKPYQPAGYWSHLKFPARTYVADEGDAQYRRGLYVHWQRQFLHPALKVFDAPSREECTAERPRSNTPLAALALLNDPTQVEAARVMAQRILQSTSIDDNKRLQSLAMRVLSRPFDLDEISILGRLLDDHRAQYQDDRKGAEQLVGIGLAGVDNSIDLADLAAWTSVVRAVLNLHETITRN